MQDLSELNKKCLTNMPMMLDVILTTVNNLKNIFLPVYDEIENCLNKELISVSSNGYSLDYCSIEKGGVYFLGDENDDEGFSPKLDLRYSIPVSRTYRNRTYSFEVSFGYIVDEVQNVIYFQLFDTSNNCYLLDDIKKNTLLQQLPGKWGKGGDEKSVFIEFNIDETLSIDKIKKCTNSFKCYILEPFIIDLRNQ